MKLKFLTVIASFLFSLCGYAQTRGTNALSFGVDIYTSKSESFQTNTIESKYSSFTLGYGIFISDQSKIGVELIYGKNEASGGIPSSEGQNYGGNMSYQHYYPIVKTLYAYAGGKAGYNYNKSSYNNFTGDSYQVQETIGNRYSIGAYGGLTWFLSKRFAFETNLLSANMIYGITKQEELNGNIGFKNKSSNFNLTTQGLSMILDLKFTCYFKHSGDLINS
jgi:hypothetical protein